MSLTRDSLYTPSRPRPAKDSSNGFRIVLPIVLLSISQCSSMELSMQYRMLAAAVLFLAFATGNARAQNKTVAERLGYSPAAKLLIIHADDLAVAHSVDSASFDALDKSAVTSASIMVPCPWITEVAAYAKAHPDADLGLHLTLTSEWTTYRWGSVAPADKVSSLLDPAGTFWSATEQVAAHAKPQEAELEVRAQIDRAIA